MNEIREKKTFTSVEEIMKNGINRDNAVVREWDRVYCNLAKEILDKGEPYVSRAGEVAGSLFAPTFKLNVGKEFPILETKKLFVKNTISELLWIYQAQTSDVQWLHDRDNHIWDLWVVGEDGYWRTIEYKEVNGRIEEKEVAKYIGKEKAGTIGEAYGFVIGEYNQTDNSLNTIKNDPYSRRNIISLWQAPHLAKGVLEPCVLWSHFVVKNGKLNLAVQQRSGDIPLGVPFNITQYAVLLSLFAKITGYEPGELSWRIDDAHIYKNQLEGMKLQLERFSKMRYIESLIKDSTDTAVISLYKILLDEYEHIDVNNKYFKELEEYLTMFELMITKPKPELYVANKDSIYDYDNQKNNKDIYVKNYKPAPIIRFPVSK